MWKLQIVETDHGSVVILPDDLAAKLCLEGMSKLDVLLRGKDIVIPTRASPDASDVATD